MACTHKSTTPLAVTSRQGKFSFSDASIFWTGKAVWLLRFFRLEQFCTDVLGDTNSLIKNTRTARGELTLSCRLCALSAIARSCLAIAACTIAVCTKATAVRGLAVARWSRCDISAELVRSTIPGHWSVPSTLARCVSCTEKGGGRVVTPAITLSGVFHLDQIYQQKEKKEEETSSQDKSNHQPYHNNEELYPNMAYHSRHGLQGDLSWSLYDVCKVTTLLASYNCSLTRTMFDLLGCVWKPRLIKPALEYKPHFLETQVAHEPHSKRRNNLKMVA